MKKWVGQIFILVVMLSCQDQDKEPEGRLPNILLITAEDISPDLGAYGVPFAQTPFLDSLARVGITFDHAYATSGVCSPSRSSLITGVHSTTLGSMHMRTEEYIDSVQQVFGYETVPPAEIRLFTEYLRNKGYYCTNNSKTDYQFEAPFTAWDENGKEAHWKNRPAQAPFFAVFNTLSTHASRIWMKADDPYIVPPEAVAVPPYYPDTETVRQELARYHTNIAIMDNEVAHWVNEVRDAGLLDHTIILFTSDHGTSLLRGKRTVYRAGIQVPLIVVRPEEPKPGSRNSQLVSLIDLAPTILSLAGIKPKKYMQGGDFLDPDFKRDYVVAAKDRIHQNYDRVRTLVNGEFQYIRNFAPELPYMQHNPYRDQSPMIQEMYQLRSKNALDSTQLLFFADQRPKEELYDIKDDPYQIHNLIHDPEYAEIIGGFRNSLDHWIQETHDLGGMDETKMVNGFLSDGKQRITVAPEITSSLLNGQHLIQITSKTPGASIGYQIGSQNWQLYQEPFVLPKNVMVQAKAIRIGYQESPITQFKNQP